MVVEFADSFDHYSTFTDKGWNGTTNITNPAAVGRTGAQGFRVTHFDHILFRNVVSQSSKIVGFAWRSGVRGDARVVGFMQGGTHLLDLRQSNSTGQLFATRNGTSLGGGGPALVINTWYYIEFKAIIGVSVTCRLNGVEIFTYATTGTGSIDRIQHGGNSSGTWNADFDDYYVVTTSGGGATDFLGDVRINCSRPVSAGTSTIWTPSAGGTNYTRVNETLADAEGSYVATGGVGNTDTYPVTDLSGSGVVHGVQVVMQARKDDAGLRQIAPVYRPTTTDTPGTTQTLGSGYQLLREVKELNPDTGLPWTFAEFNATEFGMKVIA